MGIHKNLHLFTILLLKKERRSNHIKTTVFYSYLHVLVRISQIDKQCANVCSIDTLCGWYVVDMVDIWLIFLVDMWLICFSLLVDIWLISSNHRWQPCRVRTITFDLFCFFNLFFVLFLILFILCVGY